ncbi:hypothetical protein B0H14DRAFT_3149190 [Mycena olivaceomarginata]|nr:hypothetical protein B0H14DRAFT_3149190 [Mycena olivaceomarginata]
MVLTRRAARASKSFIRWIPNEILTVAMANCSAPDLLAFCRTSRLLRNIATPLLCRSVSLTTVPQIEAFLRTMKQHSGSSLSHHVRRFSLGYYNEDHHFESHYRRSLPAPSAQLSRPPSYRRRIYGDTPQWPFSQSLHTVIHRVLLVRPHNWIPEFCQISRPTLAPFIRLRFRSR